MLLRRSVLLAAGLAAVVAAPALAAGEAAPSFRTTKAWLSCDNQPTKLYQANWAAGLGATSTYVTWDSTAPTSSVSTGAGCGGVDDSRTTNPVYDVALTGTFVGNLRDVTVTLNQLLTHRLRSVGTERLRMTGDIDGVPIFPPGVGSTSGRTVTVTPVASATGASESMAFTITGLGTADGKGVALEEGDGDDEHVLTLFIGLDGAALQDRPGAWAWDTTETPSGLVFNPAAPEKATVKADTPDFTVEEEQVS